MISYEALVAHPTDIIVRMKFWDKYNEKLRASGWTIQTYEAELLKRIDQEWSKMLPN